MRLYGFFFLLPVHTGIAWNACASNQAFLPSNARSVGAFSTSLCFPHDLRRAVCASSF